MLLRQAALLLVMMLGVLAAPYGESRAQGAVCSDQAAVSSWLEVAMTTYWIHHKYVGYPPQVDWETTSTLLAWSKSQSTAQLTNDAVNWRLIADGLEAIDPTGTNRIANDSLVQTYRTTADVLDILATGAQANSSQLEVTFSNMKILVANSDILLTDVISNCNLRIVPVAQNAISCLDVLIAYHGEWAKGYYGSLAYIFVMIQSGRGSLDQGSPGVAIESANSIRDAAYALSTAPSPQSVFRLQSLTAVAMTSIADLLQAQANLALGAGSQGAVDAADQNARLATDAMDAEASAIFQTCDALSPE